MFDNTHILKAIESIQEIKNSLLLFEEANNKAQTIQQIKANLKSLNTVSINLNDKKLLINIHKIGSTLELLNSGKINDTQNIIDMLYKEIIAIEEVILKATEHCKDNVSIWDKIKDMQIDVLKEIGNIGAGNAATALSQLLNKTIDMKVPQVEILSFDEISNTIGGPENLVVAVFLRMEGDISGNMFFILQQENAKQFTKIMLGETEDSGDSFSEMEFSVIQEIGNILSGSYLSALSNLTSLDIQPSVPMLAIDMAAAVLGYGLLEVGKIGDYALVIDSTFIDTEDNRNIKGHFLLLPDPDAFEALFNSLGVPLNE